MARYYEDVDVGETASFGRHTVTEDEIVSFAEQYDPQPMHLDPAAAAETMYGGLIASGWHTASVTMRLLVDDYLDELATLGGRGVDRLRWVRPVRPDETLTVETEVLEKTPERPEWGTLRTETVTRTADDEPVMTMVALVMVARRDGDGASAE